MWLTLTLIAATLHTHTVFAAPHRCFPLRPGGVWQVKAAVMYREE